MKTKDIRLIGPIWLQRTGNLFFL